MTSRSSKHSHRSHYNDDLKPRSSASKLTIPTKKETYEMPEISVSAMGAFKDTKKDVVRLEFDQELARPSKHETDRHVALVKADFSGVADAFANIEA
jgi:hypothetical protein